MDQSVRDRLDPRVPAALAVTAAALFAVLLLVGAGTVTAVAAAAVLLLLATIVALVGWRAGLGRERRLGALAEALRKEHADERERLERHARRLEDTLSSERVLLRRLRDAWQSEREWSRELAGSSTSSTAAPRDGATYWSSCSRPPSAWWTPRRDYC